MTAPGTSCRPLDPRAVRHLLHRVVPGSTETTEITAISDCPTACYEYSADQGRLRVAATDTSAACAGVYAYLKDVCGAQVTWDTALPLDIRTWPDAEPVRRSTPAQVRYYFNVVTTGYSAAFWDWQRWEAEIDWMALHGITMPLMVVGHETVLFRAFTGLGAPESAVRSWLGSAAHLPWTLMGATNSWGGPLPGDWFARREQLAQRILTRQRELGMRPVLPAFGGHIPDVLASVETLRTRWQDFSTALLDPQDDRFEMFAGEVNRVQQEMFGTDHLYSADPFIESVPPVGDPATLAEHARAVHNGMAANDPQAVWVMQAWPFHFHRNFWTRERIDAVTGSVPAGRLLLLDLWAEHAPVWNDGRGIARTPWLWCAVHNFGGRFSVHGDLHGLARDLGSVLDSARENGGRPDWIGSFAGTGLAMEAIENNPAFYELATDVVWGTPDVSEWVERFVCQRYALRERPAAIADAAVGAWQILLQTLYRPGATRSTPSPIIARPWDVQAPFATQRAAGEFLDPDAPVVVSANVDAESDPHVEGDLEAIAAAADRLLVVVSRWECRDRSGGPAGSDLVDLLTHLLAQRMRAVIHRISDAGRNGDEPLIRAAGRLLTRALDDLDTLAATQPDRRLSEWVAAAVRWGTGDAEQQTLARDARRILTVWGAQTSGLHDYSGRHWSGLLSGFYKPRWQLWVDWLADAADRGTGPDPKPLHDAIVELEERWIAEPTIDVAKPQEKLSEIAVRLLSRYRAAFFWQLPASNQQ